MEIATSDAFRKTANYMLIGSIHARNSRLVDRNKPFEQLKFGDMFLFLKPFIVMFQKMRSKPIELILVTYSNSIDSMFIQKLYDHYKSCQANGKYYFY